jgi:cysteinyl-tRNA synthetase
LFNTLTRRKEIFKPMKNSIVKIYTCGLTVYDFAHIGNIRAFMFADILRRYLEFKGFKVIQVLNFTDVGHMFEDADIGKDKIEATAKKEKKDPWSIAEYYINTFIEDSYKMNLKEPNVRPRATDNITEMIELIQRIIDNGYAYVVNGSVYFDINKFKEYGKLSDITIENLRHGAGGRVNYNPEKRNQFDFVLWINDSGHIMNWKSPWCRKGYPGWHIECSAMAMKYLGETIDIHTGGVDNIFPHHENEIAQSEAATGKKFVNYWLHVEHLIVEGRKMSKSLGNFYTLRHLLSKGYDSRSVRYLLMATHYRQQLNFTFKGLEAAKSAINRLVNFIHRLKYADGDGDEDAIMVLTSNVQKCFTEAMDDDLNISAGLATVFDFVREVNRLMDINMLSKYDAEKAYDVIKKLDSVLGLLGEIEEDVSLSEDVKELIQEREEARKKLNWKKADTIRKKLKRKGIIIEDTPNGPRIKILSD